ncbi:hypothetical protein MNV49_000399 [Pseudohyphozyma bogoriensis]|nr:hypothetical protein MNV49_000399 [Pseudohyphozyma bogoriensis]
MLSAAPNALPSTQMLPFLAHPPAATGIPVDELTLAQMRTRTLANHIASINDPNSINTDELKQTLSDRQIPPEAFALWVTVLAKKDLVFALDKLGLFGLPDDTVDSQGNAIARPDVPKWLLLALPGMARSIAGAPYLAGLFYSLQYQQLGPQEQGMFIARCLQHFLRVRHYTAAREVVDLFCANPPHLHHNPLGDDVVATTEEEFDALPANHKRKLSRRSWAVTYARCLASLSRTSFSLSSYSETPRDLLHSLRDALRASMVDHDVPRTLATYWPLFSPALIPTDPREAEELLDQMREDGVPLEPELVRAVSRAYLKAGDLEGAEAVKESTARELKARQEWIDQQRKLEGSLIPFARSGSIGGVFGDGGPAEVDEIDEYLEFVIQCEFEKDEQGLDVDGIDGLEKEDSAFTVAMEPEIEVESETEHNDSRPYRRQFSNSHSIQVLARKKTPSEALAYFDTILYPRPFHWVALLTVLSRSKDASSDHILSVVDAMEAAGQHLNTTRGFSFSWAIALEGLKFRKDHERACQLWENRLGGHVNETGMRITLRLLTPVVQSYIALWDVKKAEEVIATYARRPNPTRPRRRGRNEWTLPFDNVPFTSLMTAYTRMGNYRKAFDLFKSLEKEFMVLPDVISLTILLDAARVASAKAGRGWGPGSEGIACWNLRNRQLDIWDGTPAHLVAERIAWKVLEENYPRVEIVSPMTGPTVTSRLSEWAFPTKDPDSDGRIFPATLSHIAPAWPQIYPNRAFFKAFIRLVGFHGSFEDLPKLLAWMRYLKVWPDRESLIIALLYVGEGNPKMKDLQRLREWLVDWLGEENVPSEDEVAAMRRRPQQEMKAGDWDSQ